MLWICLRFRIFQGSDYGSSSKYIWVLDIPFRKYKKVPFPENYKFFWEKIRNFFRAGFLGKNVRNFLGKTFRGLRPKSALGSCIIYYWNPLSSEAEFRNSVGLIPVGGNSPSIGRWIVRPPVIQHKETKLTKYWDVAGT